MLLAPGYQDYQQFCQDTNLPSQPHDEENLPPEIFPALIKDDEEKIKQSEGAQFDLDDEHNEHYCPL